jgi:hypothetical protein
VHDSTGDQALLPAAAQIVVSEIWPEPMQSVSMAGTTRDTDAGSVDHGGDAASIDVLFCRNL